MRVPTTVLLLVAASCSPHEPSFVEPRKAPEASPPSCAGTGSSNLPGVRIVFPDQPCTFSLAQAAAGIRIVYDVVIDAPLAGVVSRPQDAGGASRPGKSGLNPQEILEGNGQRYCMCDTGLGPDEESVVDLVAGTFPCAFEWTGRNWSGPSDTGNRMGAPFPAGSYTLCINAVGSYRGADYWVKASRPVQLTP